MEKQKIEQTKNGSQEAPKMEKLDLEKLEEVSGGLAANSVQLGSVHRKSPLPF